MGGFVQRELKESQYVKKVLERTKSTADALRLGLQHKLENAIARYKFELKNSLETVLKTIESPEVGGCLQTLDHAYDLFHETPGFKDVLKNVVVGASGPKSGDLSRAKGAFYELKVGITLTEQGEEIVELGYRLKDKAGKILCNREHDILTKTKLIECKNKRWDMLQKIDYDSLGGQIGTGVKNAKILGVDYYVCSKNPIPDDIKEWIIGMGAKIMEIN